MQQKLQRNTVGTVVFEEKLHIYEQAPATPQRKAYNETCFRTMPNSLNAFLYKFYGIIVTIARPLI